MYDNVIPYGRQSISEADVKAVVEVLHSDFLTTGPMLAAFEERFCDAVGARHAAAVSNGTTALHLVTEALDLPAGAQVIVPSMTFLASANAQIMAGAEVVFADVDPVSGLMTAQTLRDALARAPNARAAVVVHMNGLAADMPALWDIAKANNLYLIEDACHALGSHYAAPDGSFAKVGACAHSTAATFSFHPVKTIATGEGGMITTADPDLIERIQRLRSHGMSPGQQDGQNGLDPAGVDLPWKYEMADLGWNYRLSAIQAALGVSQLERLPQFIARRQEIVARYDQFFAALSDHITPVSRAAGPSETKQMTGWHLYPIHMHGGSAQRLAVFNWLLEHNIRPQIHYFPVHRQPYYRTSCPSLALHGADTYYSGVLSLPLFYGLSDEALTRIEDTITRFPHF